MIEGVVVNAAYEAVITVSVHGPAGKARQVEAVIDTGFDRFLVLPSSLVTELGLPFLASGPVTLANGSEENLEVYEVSVMWDGQSRDVYTYVADTTPLVGMMLLDGYNLNIEVEDAGRVLIQPIA